MKTTLEKKRKGETFLYRRPSRCFDLSCYGPCPKCLLWISKKLMSRHQSACYAGERKLTKGDIVKATLVTAGVDDECNEELKTPSNAVKLEYDIKRMISIKIGYSLIKKNKVEEEEAEDCLKTMNVFWGTRVAKLARTLLVERQFKKRVPLPESSDIKKLNLYLNAELSLIDIERVDLDNYIHIAKFLCVKLVQYNRRRPGEIEDITLKDYDMRVSGSHISNIFGDGTEFERKLMEEQDVVTSRGKGHKEVPTLIPEVAKAGMAFIFRNVRKAVGINIESPYLFASTDTRYNSVDDALADCCKKADLQYPERVTSTNLRKCMATMTQVLDLKPHQLDWVIRYMGHSLDIHKIYYTNTSDVFERTQIAQILLLQDTDRFSEFSNTSLDNIRLSDLATEETEDTTDQDVLTELLEVSKNLDQTDEADEDTADDTIKVGKLSKNSAKSRQKWSADEEEEIRRIFHSCFEKKESPTQKQCLKAIKISRRNNGLIRNRKKRCTEEKSVSNDR